MSLLSRRYSGCEDRRHGPAFGASVLGQQADQAAAVQLIADEIIRHENYSCILGTAQKRLAIVRQQSSGNADDLFLPFRSTSSTRGARHGVDKTIVIKQIIRRLWGPVRLQIARRSAQDHFDLVRFLEIEAQIWKVAKTDGEIQAFFEQIEILIVQA